MYPLVEAAAVLPPADAMALSGRPIAMAHHFSSPQLVIIDLHRKASKNAMQAAGRPSSLSRVVPPPDSSVARKTAAKAIWQRRKKHSMHEQYASVWLDVEC
jgi:hypothetical protein